MGREVAHADLIDEYLHAAFVHGPQDPARSRDGQGNDLGQFPEPLNWLKFVSKNATSETNRRKVFSYAIAKIAI